MLSHKGAHISNLKSINSIKSYLLLNDLGPSFIRFWWLFLVYIVLDLQRNSNLFVNQLKFKMLRLHS